MADASASRPEAAAASDRELFRKRFKKSDKLEELEGSRDGKRIYRAVDKDTMFEVAWHELPLGKAEQVDDRAAEAPVPEHENLLKVVAKWEEPGPPKKLVVITEMVDAGTLQLHIERIKDDVRVNVVKKWCRQILSGLQHLHVTTGRLHGDVRLNNIFMNSVTGDVRLGYLDVEHTLGSASGGGTSSATAAYAAPEGVHGPPADIYSFGICLLHMVTGERPYWVEPSELATQTQQAKQSGQDPITLTKYRFDASAERIIRACGITFEEFKLKRVSVSAHMTLFFKPPPGARGADDVIRYRTVAFTFNRDERNRIASLARELVDWRLIHPEDEAVATAWLDASLGRLAAAPYAYCRPLRASAQGTDPSGSMRRRRDARPRQDLGFDPSGAAQRTPAEQDQPALPPPARDTGAQQGTAPPAVPPAHAPAGDPMQPASAPRDRAGSIASTATGAPAANVLLQRQHSPDGAPAHASSAHGDASSAAERHLPGSAQDAGQADSDRRTA
ncbi:hypothetical protein FNF27_02073 [Cafeteria roenbergensis]|uniref:Protein kinase domain-containing protein n=1 Tax=Cafeteria roenbergensis TaxID=33653 RepID=A0A5A8DPL0_CAFRO|nr:hypothetical protein FNF31_01289 [Cafeteria roenbergensis]KAA0167322.1 hypothetical protein FNF28_02854 [Cafeteria roenbergensis]KAA0176377.1 hypothetical protein FNF27_02073 [Cafeteria roenbergensis]